MSAEVSESSVDFMKNRSKFVYDLARLAKFWNQQIMKDCYIPGRSLIIELLAVKVAEEEEDKGNNNHNPDMDRTFKVGIKFKRQGACVSITSYQ